MSSKVRATFDAFRPLRTRLGISYKICHGEPLTFREHAWAWLVWKHRRPASWWGYRG